MKTLKHIQIEIKDTLKQIKGLENMRPKTPTESKQNASELKKQHKHLEFLRLVEKYLEHSPRKEFLQSELDKLNLVLNKALGDWDSMLKDNPHWNNLPISEVTKKKNEFLKDVPTSTYKKQIATLEFILS